MKTINRNKLVAATSTGLLFIAIIGIAILNDSNGSLNKLLRDSKLDSEKLLSEKLSSDKQVELSKKQLASLGIKSIELQKQLDEANSKISEKDKKLKKQNSNNNSKKLQAELASLNKTKSALENQIKELNMTIASMKASYDLIVADNDALAKENNKLTGNIETLKALAASNYRVEATKGKKEKLTVSAKQANKLTLGIDVPQEIATSIKFKITSPTGKVIKDNDKALSIQIQNSENSMLYASASDALSEIIVSKRVEMSYNPKEKLSKGVYQIEVFNGSMSAGKCQVKLK